MLASPYVTGLVAGLLSALLFVSAANGSILAVLLFCATPLPLFVAGLGFGLPALLIAGAVAALAAGMILNVWLALVLVLTAVIPAALLARLPPLHRPVDPMRPDAGVEWYPPGRMTLWAGVLGALVIFASVLTAGGSAEAYRTQLADLLLRFLQTEQGGTLVPEGVEPEHLAAFLTNVLPPMMATMWAAALLVTLWLGVRITSAIGRLKRPWPAFSELEFPRSAAPIFAVCVAASFLAPGLIGLLAGLLSAGLFAAYTLLGLASLHRWSLGARHRALFLAVLYLALVLLPSVALVVAGFGFADNAFGRRVGSPPPPHS